MYADVLGTETIFSDWCLDLEAVVLTSQQRLEVVAIQSERLDGCWPVNKDWEADATN